MAGATMKGTGTARTMITATGMHTGMNMVTDTTSNNIPTA
jgi:hypothetical protein